MFCVLTHASNYIKL